MMHSTHTSHLVLAGPEVALWFSAGVLAFIIIIPLLFGRPKDGGQ